MELEIIKERELLILQKLAIYKFLTKSHFIGLGLANNDKGVTINTQRLIQWKFVRTFPMPASKRLVYTLTKKGADFAGEFRETFDPKYDKTPRKAAPMTMPHTLAIIDFHIEATKLPLTLFETDFDFIGSQKQGTLKKKTAIYFDDQCVIPDIVFKVYHNHQELLFLGEVERTYEKKKRRKYLIDKLDAYLRLIKHDNAKGNAVRSRYPCQSTKHYKILFNVEDFSYIQTLMNWYKEQQFQNNLHEVILLKTFTDDIYEGWINVLGERRLLYSK